MLAPGVTKKRAVGLIAWLACLAPLTLWAGDETSRETLVARCGAGRDDACLALRQLRPLAGVDALAGDVLRKKAQGPPAPSERACLAGDAAACASLALRDKVDAERAHRWHRLACAQGYWFSCNNLELEHGDLLGARISLIQYRQACAQDRGTGINPGADCYCYYAHYTRLGQIDGEDPDEKKAALAALRKSCDLGYGTACYSLAAKAMFYDPDSYPALLRLACERGSPDACEELRTPASELEQACRQGIKAYCKLLQARKAETAK
ncbi:MAG: sel1 repeat family protein [Deltaproteobacteria bacterium]|nr:sel1 repeat family protein [Deltaproteobacteria bacterium]